MERPTTVEVKILHQGKLLKNAVAAMPNIGHKAAVFFSPRGLEIQVVDTSRILFPHERVIAVLRLHATRCDHFYCRITDSVGINLVRLHEILGEANDDDAITIFVDYDDNTMSFVFDNFGSSETKYSCMDLIQHYVPRLNVIESQVRVAVGIPSQVFRDTLMKMRYFEGQDDDRPIDIIELLAVNVTTSKLQFCVKDNVVELKPEDGEYEIRGATDDDFFYVMITLYRLSSYLQAALLSNKVWIYVRNDEIMASDSNLLKCPVGQLGSLFFALY